MTTARRRIMAGVTRLARRAPLVGLVMVGVVVGVLVVAGVAATAGEAHAATAYRYWSYYVGHGTTWQFSQRGPSSEYPVDGEVQGWRFAVQTEVGNEVLPRTAPDFATLCGSTPAQPGQLRVGIVIDFGDPSDAPPHEAPPASVVPGCVHVAVGGSGADVLQAAARVRIGTGSEGGLVCGIDGYPKTECAAVVTTPKPSGTPKPAASPSSATPAKPTKGPSGSGSGTASSGTASSGTASSSTPSSGTASSGTGSAAGTAPTTPNPSTLAQLRSAGSGSHPFPTAAVLGAALVIALGAGAAWRARSGSR